MKKKEYHDLYVKNYTLLLSNVFENYRNMFVEIYELDPTRISMVSSFKKDQRKV